METKVKKIEYPYLPEGRNILYVPADNEFMMVAKEFAKKNSLDKTIQTGAVIVFNGSIVGFGANGSDYHENHGCYRVLNNIPTGQGYDLCDGCNPKNHAEPKAIKNAEENGFNTKGADLYLWGHWWCCQSCWKAMIDAGIKEVYLIEGSEILFDKNNPQNIIGHQFE